MIPFSASDEVGNLYHQPVVLTPEHGVTYAAPDAGAFALNDSIALTMKDAQVTTYQMVMRSQMSYEAAARASKDKKAFRKATELLFQNMYESMAKRVQVDMLYGSTGHGTGTALCNFDIAANVDTTHTRLTATTATWAPGVWAGSENMKLHFYDNASAYPLISSGADAIFTVYNVDFENRYVYVSGTTTGITALDAHVASAGTNSANAYYYNSYAKQMAGLDKIILNAGILFNIDAATYSLWKGSTYGAGSAALTIAKVLAAIQRAVEKGLMEDATMFCNPRTWGNLNGELAGNRRFDGSYKRGKGDNGFEVIEYYSQNGKIAIYSEACVKEGEAFIVPIKRLKRIGSTDITFNSPGNGDRIFRELADNAGFEVRCYSGQTLFCEAPAKCVKITGIVNS